MKKKTLKVGVTGGIGSGKTTVMSFFRDLGVPVYIADERAKKLMYSDEEIRTKIKTNFGQKTYQSDGALNTTYLANLVFNDPKKLGVLNEIVHPKVGENFNNWVLGYPTSPYVLYESALIFENNHQSKFDFIILVIAPEDLRIKRVKKRSQLTEKQIRDRINTQMSDIDKSKNSDYIINNIDINKTKQDITKINTLLLNNYYK